MIGQQEEATLKGAVLKLNKEVGELKEKVEGVVTAQGKVESTLQEFATARRNGTPVQLMKAETVEKTIKDNLNSQLISSTVNVKVNDTVATIEKQSKEKIDSLITAAENLVESNKSIKPRKPLLNLTIHDGKKAIWFGVGLAGLFLIGMVWAIVWANNKVNSIQDQAFYWGNRAYQAALLSDDEDPGESYHVIMSHFTEDPEKSKEVVEALEKRANRYEEIKQYLLSFIGKSDTRDIRVLDWEINHGEGWFLYRFYDEEAERSVHVWPDKKIEETTDKIVTDLASAQKYSKRKIWTVIREASPAPEE